MSCQKDQEVYYLDFYMRRGSYLEKKWEKYGQAEEDICDGGDLGATADGLAALPFESLSCFLWCIFTHSMQLSMNYGDRISKIQEVESGNSLVL